ncbi:MAG: hypothetical protein OXG83_17430 [Acidobacteria bacterium]|nr:hypothetical protein [Acidobacteriota bacterium]
MSDHELPWPRLGVPLFRDGHHHTYLQINDPSFVASQFQAAGDALLEHCLNNQRDWVMRPALYCYRHSVEMYLKTCIVLYTKADLPDEDRNHDLQRLWTKVKTLLEQAGDDKDDAVLAVDGWIEVLAAWDPKGESFRYADTKTGIRRGFQQPALNAVDLRRTMEMLSTFLEGCADFLNAASEP